MVSHKFEYNDFLLCAMIFLRTYFFTRSLLRTTQFTDPRAQRVCNMYGAEATYKFALKALMKNNSEVLITIITLTTMLLFGYSVRIFERHVQDDFNFINNSFWFTLVTLTTVGYGDYYPRTNPGQVLAVVLGFVGNFITSLFVVSMNNSLEF